MIFSKEIKIKDKKKNHISLWASLMVLATVMVGIQPAHAGSYSDELSQCLVRSTTNADKATIIQWFFALMALHPDLDQISSITQSQRIDINKNIAKLFESLLTQTCKSQTQAVIRYEGTNAFEKSFGVLGETAMTDLLSNPTVSARTTDFIKYMDMKKLEKMLGDTP